MSKQLFPEFVKFDFRRKIFVVLSIFCLFQFFSCDAVDYVPTVQPTGTVKDADGNVYKTIKIGNQWWMQENLKVTKYRNGVPIPLAQAETDWMKKSAVYCIYNNEPAAPGLLYNFYAVSDSNRIAPYGWHVPSDEEWKELEMYLGMSKTDVDKVNWRGSLEGDKLKVEAPEGWIVYPNVWGSNECKFQALAGSCRLYNGTFGFPGLFSTAFWWSSTQHAGEAWYRYLDYKNSDVFRYYGSKNYGFSIRCVKD